MNHVLRTLCAFCVAITLLAACSVAAPSSSAGPAVPSQAPAPAAPSAAQSEAQPLAESAIFEALSFSFSDGYYPGDEYGCYLMKSYGDATADIFYIDYAARRMEKMPLKKVDEAAVGALPATMPMGLVLWENVLYVLKPGRPLLGPNTPETMMPASIYGIRVDDGAINETPLPEGYVMWPDSKLLCDGGALYFTVYTRTYTELGEENSFSIAKYQMDSGAIELIAAFEPGELYALEGACGWGFVLKASTDVYYHRLPAEISEGELAAARRQYRVYLWEQDGGGEVLLDEYVRGESGSKVVVDGNRLYRWQPETGGNLTELNLDTMEEKPVDVSPEIPRDGVMDFTGQRYGSLLEFRFQEIRGDAGTGSDIFSETWILDIDTGKILDGARFDKVFVCAAGGKWLLLQENSSVSEPVYKLISREDFFAGAEVYETIEP